MSHSENTLEEILEILKNKKKDLQRKIIESAEYKPEVELDIKRIEGRINILKNLIQRGYF